MSEQVKERPTPTKTGGGGGGGETTTKGTTTTTLKEDKDKVMGRKPAYISAKQAGCDCLQGKPCNMQHCVDFIPNNTNEIPKKAEPSSFPRNL